MYTLAIRYWLIYREIIGSKALIVAAQLTKTGLAQEMDKLASQKIDTLDYDMILTLHLWCWLLHEKY